MEAITKEPLLAPSRVVSGIPEELDRIVMRARVRPAPTKSVDPLNTKW